MEQLNSEKLLIVEGKEDKVFLELLLKEMNLITNMQIISVDSKDKLKARFGEIINTSGFENVKTLAIIFDSDNTTKERLESIQNILKYYELPFPKSLKEAWVEEREMKVGIFIIETMLEDLCLEIAKNKKTINCIKTLETCIKPQEVHPKALMNLFLAVEGTYKDKLGKTLENKELFDLSYPSEQLNTLKQFLQEFVK